MAGVYGVSSNSGTAPHYGGYFLNLKACGITLKPRYVVNEDVQLLDTDSLVAGFTDSLRRVTLPATKREGLTIFVKQVGTGTLRFYTQGSHEIRDDSTVNQYYDCGNGQGLIFHFTNIFSTQDGSTTRRGVWLVSRYKY